MKLLKFFIFLSFTVLPLYAELKTKNILVLVDNQVKRNEYSIFFEMLNERGYKLSFYSADSPDLLIHKYNNYIYDHIIIFAPSIEEFGGQVNVEELLKFVDSGRNILIAGNSNIGGSLRELAVRCGMEYDEAGTAVIDHMHFIRSNNGKHTNIWVDTSSNLIKAPVIVGNGILNAHKYVKFDGIGILLNPDNELVFPIVKGWSTSYCYDPTAPNIKAYPHAVGHDLALVAGLQARNNARLVFSGSVNMFSNEAFTAKNVKGIKGNQEIDINSFANKEFAESLTKWVFKETGVLRAGNVTHIKKNDVTVNPLSYTITDDISYSIDIETLDKNGNWVPFQAKDIQLEFVRIDPFIRTFLKYSNGKYVANFKLPDVYGVFQFKVDYLRLGYTHLKDSKQVSVRPFQHTQYERFISSAYPYYASAFLMIAMTYALIFIVLYDKESYGKNKSD